MAGGEISQLIEKYAGYFVVAVTGPIGMKAWDYFSKKDERERDRKAIKEDRFEDFVTAQLDKLEKKVAVFEVKLDDCERRHDAVEQKYNEANVQLAISSERLKRIDDREASRMTEAEKDKLIAMTLKEAVKDKPSILGLKPDDRV